MLKNYLKIAVRTLLRHPGYSAINILGLAIGVASSLLIGLYVFDEWQYDRFNEHAENIYRIQVGEEQVVTPTVVAPLMQRTVPEVIAAARLYDIGRFRSRVVANESVRFFENRFFYADSTVFDVFTLPFVAGAPADALTRPNTIVLTESMARKYFGDRDPIGAMLRVDDDGYFEVTGVMADVPAQSHIQFDFLASFASVHWSREEIWDSANFNTYARLTPGTTKAALNTVLENLVEPARADSRVGENYTLTAHPLLEIRLYDEGHIRYIVLLGTVALLILLIACVNYINLATARATERAREVGVRKVVGAERQHLMSQFLGESLLTTLLAVGLAIIVALGALPFLNAVSGKHLALSLGDIKIWGVAAGIVLVVGLLGGSYPALLLSSFRPVRMLKSKYGRGGGFRRPLVVFQFTVSVVMMIGTFVVYQQMRYVQEKDLGFDKEHLIVLPMGSDRIMHEAYRDIRAALLRAPEIQEVAAVNHIPGYQRGGYGLWAEGHDFPEEPLTWIGGVPSDPYVVETLGLRLIAGEGFIDRPADSLRDGSYQYLLNEAAIRASGWSPDEAIGQRVALSSNRDGVIVGVIQDYHFLSMHQAIGPMAYFLEPSSVQYMLVKTTAGSVPDALRAIEALWNERITHRPFTYSFLDEEMNRLYRAEEQMNRIFTAGAILALSIACLGLLGLAAYSTSRRTKEVGIRKTLGASERQIVLLLSKEFTWLVGIGFLIAVPIAYWTMNQWLQTFAYQISISPMLFLGVGCLVLLIAWVTIGTQAIRAAFANPVNSLRYE